MASVLILTLVFRPDNVSTAQLMADLAEDLQSRGHTVTVLTSDPHYNEDSAANEQQPMVRTWLGLVRRSSYKGIPVLHTWMPRKGKNKIYRALTWLAFHAISTVAGCLMLRRVQLILSPSPPITIGLSAWILSLVHGAQFIYNVQEIYPDVAINLGAIKNRWIIDALFGVERFVYRKAAVVTVISVRMQARLVQKGVPVEKVVVIPNFVDVTDFKPLDKNNEFSRRYGLAGKFVVSYAGNMGQPQHLETLLYAADKLRSRTGVHFFFMGDGSEAQRLQALAESLHLANVTFLKYQPYALMPLAYAAADISYVPQAIGTSADGIPSKVYRIMAAGRPVLACTDPDSDLASLVTEAACGHVITSHDPKLLADTIGDAADSPSEWRRRGLNGREHVLKYYERTGIVGQYDTQIRRVLKLSSSGVA